MPEALALPRGGDLILLCLATLTSFPNLPQNLRPEISPSTLIIQFGNRPSKYLARLVNKKSDSQCISAVKDVNVKRKTDTVNINKVIERYYSQLYKSDQPIYSQGFSEVFFVKFESF